jgi:biopolymer transport protein ExbD
MMRLGPVTMRRRRPNLIPMIDVMVLLMVFFMLASRYGGDHGLPLQMAGAAAGYSGPPRLVQVDAAGLALNGVALGDADLLQALAPLMTSPDDMVVLRAGVGVDVQRVVSLMGLLQTAGLRRVVLVE